MLGKPLFSSMLRHANLVCITSRTLAVKLSRPQRQQQRQNQVRRWPQPFLCNDTLAYGSCLKVSRSETRVQAIENTVCDCSGLGNCGASYPCEHRREIAPRPEWSSGATTPARTLDPRGTSKTAASGLKAEDHGNHEVQKWPTLIPQQWSGSVTYQCTTTSAPM